MKVSVKICGITTPADAHMVLEAGADALGLNFIPSSRRRVSIERAAQICESVGTGLIRVGLFADQDDAYIRQVLQQVPLDVIQFHGGESGTFCESFHRPYIKAIPIFDGSTDWSATVEEYASACALLLDAATSNQFGGQGETFDWQHWPGPLTLPLVLAGGLTPENVAAAVTRCNPDAVDVSSGVEGDQKGKKVKSKVLRFIEEVRACP